MNRSSCSSRTSASRRWVTPDRGAPPARRCSSCARPSRGPAARPLERRELEVSTDALVIGAGPRAEAALTLAERAARSCSWRRSDPGGMPVLTRTSSRRSSAGRASRAFMAEALHGPLAERIELLLLSELVSVKGSFGNFSRRCGGVPFRGCRNLHRLHGCIEACPSRRRTRQPRHEPAQGDRLRFFGGLPNARTSNPRCTRFAGQDCERCARPADPGVVRLDEQEELIERRVGHRGRDRRCCVRREPARSLGYGCPASSPASSSSACSRPAVHAGSVRLSTASRPNQSRSCIAREAGPATRRTARHLLPERFQVQRPDRTQAEGGARHPLREDAGHAGQGSDTARPRRDQRDKTTLVSCGGPDAVKVEAEPDGRKR